MQLLTYSRQLLLTLTLPPPPPRPCSYDVHLGATADPFLHRFRHHPRHPGRLRLDAVADAAALLVGTHDFSNFANVSADGARKSPVKTIRRYQLVPLEGGVRWAGAGAGLHRSTAVPSVRVGRGLVLPPPTAPAAEARPPAAIALSLPQAGGGGQRVPV